MSRPDPVILYDTTLRDGTQGENITLSLADKLRVARMLDEYGFPFIEGGWPGSNPKDIEFFAAARKITLAAREAGGVRLDPPQGEQARRRPEPAGARRGRDARRHDLRQELAAPRDRGPGRDAAENLDMIADSVGFIAESRPRGRLRRRALLRRLPRRPRLRAGHAARRPRGRRPDARPVRHERRHADRRAGADPGRRPRLARGRPGLAGRHLGHPHPQRRRARGRQLDRRRAGRRPPRPGDDQRLRRALRQREHGLDPRQPRAQDAVPARAARWRRPGRPDRPVALGRGDRQRQTPTTTSRTSAGRRSPTRAASTAPRWPRSSAATSTSIPSPSATPGGSSSPSWAARRTRRSARASWATSSRASSIRRPSASSSSSSRTRASPSRAPRRRSSS